MSKLLETRFGKAAGFVGVLVFIALGSVVMGQNFDPNGDPYFALRSALPAGTNNLGDVDVLTFPDNEPFNLAQAAGNTLLTGNGVTGTGSPRVTIASDNTPFSVNVGTFPDNEPINLGEVGGTSTLTGGTAGSLAIGGQVAHSGTFGSTNPAVQGFYVEGDASALDSTGIVETDITRGKADVEGRQLVRIDHLNRFYCNMLSTAVALTEITGCGVPGAGVSRYITDITFSSSIVSAVGADAHPTLKYGTGTNCATGTTTFWRSLSTANFPIAQNFQTPIKIPANNAICFIHTGAGTRVMNIIGFIAP
jgi:hypothetical protein